MYLKRLVGQQITPKFYLTILGILFLAMNYFWETKQPNILVLKFE